MLDDGVAGLCKHWYWSTVWYDLFNTKWCRVVRAPVVRRVSDITTVLLCFDVHVIIGRTFHMIDHGYP
jgi:hypothetical protein